jgi:hypothetical protein
MDLIGSRIEARCDGKENEEAGRRGNPLWEVHQENRPVTAYA